MAVTGVNSNTAYGSYYTDTRKKGADAETVADGQKTETAAKTVVNEKDQNSKNKREALIGQTTTTYQNGKGDTCEIGQRTATEQETDAFRKGRGWKADKNGQAGQIMITKRESKGKSLLQKMRERAEEIRLKNLRKRAKAEKRAAELATKRLERKRMAMRHSKVNYRV